MASNSKILMRKRSAAGERDDTHRRVPARTWYSRAFDDTIKIIVTGSGQAVKEFLLHKGVATYRSPTIRQMCNDNPEAIEFKRPQWTESTFNCFMQWLYFGKFHYTMDLDSYTPLLKVYMLGKELRTTGLMSCAIMEMCRYSEAREVLFNTEHINTIYRSTPPSGALRRLVVDQYAFSEDATLINTIAEDSVTKQFLGDLSRRLLEKRVVSNPCERPHDYSAGNRDLIENETNNTNTQNRPTATNSITAPVNALAIHPSGRADQHRTQGPVQTREGTAALPLFVQSDEESDG